MHRDVSAPSCCALIHRFSFKDVSGHRDLFKIGPGNRGLSACGTTHVASLEFPRETSLILRCAGKIGNPFQTKQGNRLSFRDQEGRVSSDEVVQGTSVFPSSKTGIWGTFEVASRVPSIFSHVKKERGTSLETLYRLRASSCDDEGTTWFFSSCGRILEL